MNPDFIFFHNPQMIYKRFFKSGIAPLSTDRIWGFDCLALDNYSGGFFRRISPDVREIQILRYEYALFIPAYGYKIGVRRTAQVLVVNCFRVMSGVDKQRGNFNRKVFVNFKLHRLLCRQRNLSLA